MTHTLTNATVPANCGRADDLEAEALGHGSAEVSSSQLFTGQGGWRFTQLVALIKTASYYVAEIQIWKDAYKVDGKSLVDLLTLGVRYGDKLTIRAIGYDAQAALLAVAALPFFSPAA